MLGIWTWATTRWPQCLIAALVKSHNTHEQYQIGISQNNLYLFLKELFPVWVEKYCFQPRFHVFLLALVARLFPLLNTHEDLGYVPGDLGTWLNSFP